MAGLAKKTMPTSTKQLKSKSSVGHFGNIIDRIAPNSMQFKTDKLTLGDCKEKIYTIFNYPPEVSLEWLLFATRFRNCFVTYHLSEANKNELIENIERTISTEKVKKIETYSDVDRDESDAIINRSRELAKKIRADEGKAVNLTVSFGIYGADDDEVDKECARIAAEADGLEFTLRPMTHLQEEGFLQQLPVCRNEYGDISGIDMPIDTWSAGLGIFTNQGLNHAKGCFTGYDKSGEPVFWDIWDVSKDQNNSNLVITGTPGAGKSTAMKKLLISQVSKGDELVILDAEREYIGIGKELGANIIETSGTETKATLGQEATIINPLQIRDFPDAWDDFDTKEKLNNYLINKTDGSYKGPLSIHITFLKTWFPLYIPDLTTMHKSILEKCLYKTYADKGITEKDDPRFMEPNQFPILSDLYETINQAIKTQSINGETITEDLLKYYRDLYAYLYPAVEGTDKYIFNGHTNIDMNGTITIFDVHNLLDAPENIKNAQFCNITTFCWLKMTRDRNKPCILVVDEAHLFISKKYNQVFEWLSSTSRRFRKYFASLWLATQNISDFLQESVREFGEPLLLNPELKLCLKQRGGDIERLKTLFSLSDTEGNLVSKAGRGEGLLMVGSRKRLYLKIEVEPKMLKLISETGGGR